VSAVRQHRQILGCFADAVPLLEGMQRATKDLQAPAPPVTRIGVAALFESDVLVEIEATAVVD